MIKPKKLKQGDKIGLISASAPLAGLLPQRKNRGVKALADLGFEPVIGKNAELVSGHTAGSAERKGKRFQ
jgi:muramoyltetrapeptide carboxypeptidase LdcA involved in peptidoglycan recycling